LVSPTVKAETLRTVNIELVKDSIHEVREDDFDWRMSKALPDAARVPSEFIRCIENNS
jgi:hypothetical protein